MMDKRLTHSWSSIAECIEAARSACWERTKDLGQACTNAPIQEVAKALDATDPWLGYRYIPPTVMQKWFSVRGEIGENGFADYLRLLLQYFIAQYSQTVSALSLPSAFIDEIEKVFRRMLRQCVDATLPASPEDDRYLKDLAIARGRMIPCVSHLIYRYSGVPRRAVFAQPWSRLPKLLAFFGSHGGFRPFLENHVHLAMLDEFNVEGRQRCYRMVAELLRMWPESKGLIGASWYYDPRVREISPKLAYLYEEPAKHGARFMKIASEGPKSDAFVRSVRRRHLFESGAYVPTIYLMVWPRAEILARY